MTLVIWFKDGKTAYFHNVKNLEIKQHIVGFDYLGVTSGVNREAVFILANIAGFAEEKV